MYVWMNGWMYICFNVCMYYVKCLFFTFSGVLQTVRYAPGWSSRPECKSRDQFLRTFNYLPSWNNNNNNNNNNRKKGRKCVYLTTNSPHFIYGYMASNIWLRTTQIVREETCCRHIGYSFRLTARVLLYAPSHRQDSTYHGLCYTSRVIIIVGMYACMHVCMQVCMYVCIYA